MATSTCEWISAMMHYRKNQEQHCSNMWSIDFCFAWLPSPPVRPGRYPRRPRLTSHRGPWLQHPETCSNLNPCVPLSAPRLVRVLADPGVCEATTLQQIDPVNLWQRYVCVSCVKCLKIFDDLPAVFFLNFSCIVRHNVSLCVLQCVHGITGVATLMYTAENVKLCRECQTLRVVVNTAHI